MTVLVSDSFNRANTTSGLGTTDSASGGTAYTWSTITGGTAVWGISSNQAYTPTPANDSPAVVDIGQSDNIQVQADLAVTSSIYPTGIAFRVSGNNNYFRCYASTANVKIDRMLNGTVTNIVNQNFTAVTTPFTLAVAISGSTFTVYINGSQVATATDTNLSTNTKHGMYIGNGTSLRLDNFQISSTSSGTAYSASGTTSGIASATSSETFVGITGTAYSGSGVTSGFSSATGSPIESLAGSGTLIGVSSATGSTLFILSANGNTLGIASLTSSETMNIPSIFNASGTSSGLTNTAGQAIIILLASGTASGITDAEFFRFVFSPPPECMITSQILNYNQSFPVLIQDAVGATATIINVTPDANGHFQIKLPMEEVRVMVLINGKLYLDRYIWALDGESHLPIINYR